MNYRAYTMYDMHVCVHEVLLCILLVHVQVTVTACHHVLINLLTLTGQPFQCQSVVGRIRLLPVWVEACLSDLPCVCLYCLHFCADGHTCMSGRGRKERKKRGERERCGGGGMKSLGLCV